MIWHSSDKDTVVNFFNSDENAGLPSEKAEELYALYKSENTDRPSFIKLFFSQFNNYLSVIMLAAALISVLISLLSDSRYWILSVTVIAIIFLDSIFNAAQQYVSDKMKSSVKKLRNSSVRVIRDGKETVISSDLLVPGDILLLHEGELIPADARLIQTVNFRCDEYVLTGETVDVEKDAFALAEDIAPATERRNMVFAGCSVMHGSAKSVVTDTGINTEYFKQKKINRDAKINDNAFHSTINAISKYSLIISSVVAFLIFILIIIFNLQQTELKFSNFVVESFVNAVSIIIAAIPETLPASISIILWTAIKKLNAKDNLISRSSTIEKAANVSVICAEKTGVLTPDNMTVAKIFDGRRIWDLSSETPDETACAVVKMAMICGNSVDYSDSASEINDDSGSTAINDFCLKYAALSITDCLNLYPMVSSVPFDNEHRLITTINMIGGQHYVIAKGSPETLLNLCTNVNEEALIKVSDQIAEDALRVIAVAIKPIDSVPAIPAADILENELSFLGFIGLEDIPSPEAVRTVEECERAGIRTVMITGDSLSTAKAMARRIGIFHDSMNAITGAEIKAMSDEELDRNVTLYSVFARISPNDKYRIIKALEHNNETVAVTGSRNSDAPVLRKANIGIAPANSSDVVHSAADITVKDSGIKNILDIIKTSKCVFFNIRKIIHYFLSCNIGELLTLFAGTLLFSNSVLIAAQILFINFITDVLPAISISLSPTDDSVIFASHRAHRKIFSIRSVITIGIQATAICILTLIGFSAGSKVSLACGQTMALGILGFSQILHILPSYSEKLMINSKLLRYKLIFANVAVSVLIMLAVMLTPVRNIFGLAVLSSGQWTTVIILSLVFILIDELIKIGFYIYKKFAK